MIITIIRSERERHFSGVRITVVAGVEQAPGCSTRVESQLGLANPFELARRQVVAWSIIEWFRPQPDALRLSLLPLIAVEQIEIMYTETDFTVRLFSPQRLNRIYTRSPPRRKIACHQRRSAQHYGYSPQR